MPSIKANTVPCSAIFPIPKNFGSNRASRLSLVRAQGAGDNKDTSVDVPVIQGNQVPTEERRPSPRRLAVDNIDNAVGLSQRTHEHEHDDGDDDDDGIMELE